MLEVGAVSGTLAEQRRREFRDRVNLPPLEALAWHEQSALPIIFPSPKATFECRSSYTSLPWRGDTAAGPWRVDRRKIDEGEKGRSILNWKIWTTFQRTAQIQNQNKDETQTSQRWLLFSSSRKHAAGEEAGNDGQNAVGKVVSLPFKTTQSQIHSWPFWLINSPLWDPQEVQSRDCRLDRWLWPELSCLAKEITPGGLPTEIGG